MKKLKLGVTLSLSLSLSTIVIVSCLVATSCCDNSPSNYLGDWDGKNWKGYQSGDLIVNNVAGVATIVENNDYCANDLVIPNKVKLADGSTQWIRSIKNSAFYECQGLTGNLTIGNGVEIIGASAFADCGMLTGILTISSTLKSVDDAAFARCGFNNLIFNAFNGDPNWQGENIFFYWINAGTVKSVGSNWNSDLALIYAKSKGLNNGWHT